MTISLRHKLKGKETKTETKRQRQKKHRNDIKTVRQSPRWRGEQRLEDVVHFDIFVTQKIFVSNLHTF